jgi:hypothetical protein
MIAASGVSVGGEHEAEMPETESEHVEQPQLVVFGYDGDRFLYFDPDVGGSAKPAAKPFGTLFLDRVNRRLSTAATEADFLCGADGFDRNGVHRYQVVRAYSI